MSFRKFLHMQENSVGKALEIIWKKVFILGKSKGNGPVSRREKMRTSLLCIGAGGINGGVRFLKYKKEENVLFIGADECHVEGISFQIDELGEEYKKEHKTFLIGKERKPRMALRDIKIGEKLIENDKKELMDFIPESEAYLIVAALGGGTGGASYKIAEMLREKNNKAKIIAITNTPLNLEKERREQAEESYTRLKEKGDIIINIDVEEINRKFEINSIKVFTIVDETKARLIRAIIDEFEKVKDLKGEYAIEVKDIEGEKSYNLSGRIGEEKVEIKGKDQIFYLCRI